MYTVLKLRHGLTLAARRQEERLVLAVVLELLSVPWRHLEGVGDDLDREGPEHRGVTRQRALHGLARGLEGDPLEPAVACPDYRGEELRDHEHAALARLLVEHVLPVLPHDLHVRVATSHVHDPVVGHRPVWRVQRILQHKRWELIGL